MFRPQYIEIPKSVAKLFFHESTSEQRYRTFANWVRREISLRIFRLLVEQNKHPGQISQLDVTSGPGITSGPGRTSHPVISGVCMAIYLSYVCHTGLYGHIWAYMGPNFANHSPVPPRPSPGFALVKSGIKLCRNSEKTGATTPMVTMGNACSKAEK